MTNETKIIDLIKFLNAVFSKGTTGLVANRYSEDEVCVEYNGGVEYIIQGCGGDWFVGQVYCIEGDRETPDDYDVKDLGDAPTNADVARKILIGYTESENEKHIERASLELNPDDGILF